MKKIFLSITMLASVALFSSCGNEEQKDTANHESTTHEEEKVETCTFSIDP